MMNMILLFIALFIAYKVYDNAIKIGCKCKNCGKNIKCDDQFCIYCGAKTQQQDNYQDFDYNISKDEKKHYNYYEVLDDLDGVIVSLMAKVAKSDGVISNDELNYISQRYKELANLTHKSDEVIDVYEEIFNREKNIDDNIIDLADKLRDIDESAKVYILKILEELSGIDGDNRVLNEIKKAMNFKEKENSSFYEILNSKPTDDWDTIKHNYKELVKQYHYDKLASKNLPKDLLDYAENRLKEINEAYEALKKLKN